mgnify:CR=1 FL=1
MITVEELKTKSLNQYKTYLKYLVENLQSQSDEFNVKTIFSTLY